MIVIEVDKGQVHVTLIKLNWVLIYCNILTSFFKKLFQFFKHDEIFHLEIRLKRKFFFFFMFDIFN
jgi:hypothetical protein